MITIYKNDPTGLQVIPELVEGAWVHVIDPCPEELIWLQKLEIPNDYFTYSLDLDERSRVERENGEVFILLRMPTFQGASADIPFNTVPLGIILSPKCLITVSKSDNEVLQAFTSGRAPALSTSKQLRFVLRLLLATAVKYLHYLRQITRIVDRIEDRLQLSTRNKELLELLKYQKSLTIFTTALKSNELMIQRLRLMPQFHAFPEDEDLLEDVLAETQQAIEMTYIESNILSSMMDAFASIISNNLNAVMKLLASITIIVSLPTTIASLFGMNVRLPLAENGLAFLIILGISLGISLTAGIIFWRHDWL